jgi:deoxyadenosine/deoxycytidine kinase
MKVILVEGNISSGKSSFLKALKETIPECVVIPEPVSPFYLNCLYQNMEAYFYPFQLIMATKRKICQNEAIMREKEDPNAIIILERSLFADSIFAEVGLKNREEDLKEYRIFRNEILKDILVLPDLCIYLESTPEGCLKRISERYSKDSTRKCENKIDLSYLQALHQGHEDWIRNEKRFPVITFSTEELDWRNPDVIKVLWKIIENSLQSKKSVV